MRQKSGITRTEQTGPRSGCIKSRLKLSRNSFLAEVGHRSSHRLSKHFPEISLDRFIVASSNSRAWFYSLAFLFSCWSRTSTRRSTPRSRPHKQDSFESHGSPLGVDEVRLTKQKLGWPIEPPFYIPEQARQHFRKAIERGKLAETEWRDKFSAYTRSFPDLAKAFQRAMRDELPDGWDRDIPVFPADVKGLATRVAAGKVMNAVAPRLPALIGGSADLNPSTHTALSGLGDFEPIGMSGYDKQGAVDGVWSLAGRNLYFGVREHGMGAILNGLAAHGGTLPFGATFLIFSDYMRPPIRLAALMGLHVIYVFTHDSIALGQDGPTHQPVEQLAGLRAVPGLTVIRPGDANETAVAWRVALEAENHPVALILTRQNVPTLDRTRFAPADGLRHGAYVVADAPNGKPDVILIASGSDVGLIMAARQKLQDQKVLARVVSMPSWELFDAQPQSYRTRCYCRQSMRDLPSRRVHRRAGIALSVTMVMCWV